MVIVHSYVKLPVGTKIKRQHQTQITPASKVAWNFRPSAGDAAGDVARHDRGQGRTLCVCLARSSLKLETSPGLVNQNGIALDETPVRMGPKCISLWSPCCLQIARNKPGIRPANMDNISRKNEKMRAEIDGLFGLFGNCNATLGAICSSKLSGENKVGWAVATYQQGDISSWQRSTNHSHLRTEARPLLWLGFFQLSVTVTTL